MKKQTVVNARPAFVHDDYLLSQVEAFSLNMHSSGIHSLRHAFLCFWLQSWKSIAVYHHPYTCDFIIPVTIISLARVC